MKKIILFLMAFCLLAPVVEAQNKTLEKARKKEYKTKIKEYKKKIGNSLVAHVALM